MNLDQLRTSFSDYRPGHTRPVDLRVAMGHDTGSAFVPASNLLRIHGTGMQTMALLAVLVRDGYGDLDMIDVDVCSDAITNYPICTHSYWRAPVTLMPDVVLAAVTAVPGGDAVPYIDPMPPQDDAGSQDGAES